MTDEREQPDIGLKLSNSLFDDVRQWCFPREFRIASVEPDPEPEVETETETETPQKVDPPEAVDLDEAADSAALNALVCDLATCLWYVKTRHLKLAWNDNQTVPDDPLSRRTLGRLSKAIDALQAHGYEVRDQTGERFWPGNEASMKIQMLPKLGQEFDQIAETIQPTIFHADRLIRRGEVLVEVPDFVDGNAAEGDSRNGNGRQE